MGRRTEENARIERRRKMDGKERGRGKRRIVERERGKRRGNQRWRRMMMMMMMMIIIYYCSSYYYVDGDTKEWGGGGGGRGQEEGGRIGGGGGGGQLCKPLSTGKRFFFFQKKNRKRTMNSHIRWPFWGVLDREKISWDKIPQFPLLFLFFRFLILVGVLWSRFESRDWRSVLPFWGFPFARVGRPIVYFFGLANVVLYVTKATPPGFPSGPPTPMTRNSEFCHMFHCFEFLLD